MEAVLIIYILRRFANEIRFLSAAVISPKHILNGARTQIYKGDEFCMDLDVKRNRIVNKKQDKWKQTEENKYRNISKRIN